MDAVWSFLLSSFHVDLQWHPNLLWSEERNSHPYCCSDFHSSLPATAVSLHCLIPPWLKWFRSHLTGLLPLIFSTPKYFLSTAFNYLFETWILLNHVILLLQALSNSLAWHLKLLIFPLYFLSYLRFYVVCPCRQFAVPGMPWSFLILYIINSSWYALHFSQHPLTCHQPATATHPHCPTGPSYLSMVTSSVSATPSLLWMSLVDVILSLGHINTYQTLTITYF